MTNLVIGLLATALSNNPPGMLTNVLAPTVPLHISATNAEGELNEIMTADDAAHDEVDGWIKENQVFAANGAPIPASELNERILRRLQPIREAYLSFIRRYPSNAPVRIAYASYLDGLGEEDAQAEQLDKASDLDPKNPAAWNQLANYYGHDGELTNAFACYAKAIEIDPSEPVYYWNLATTVYLYRIDAEGYYHINEQQVFDKSLALYAQALKLDPTNFSLATDLAQSYYGIRPMRTNDALVSWTNALNVAKSEIEREGVYVHLARVKTYVGLYQEAHGELDSVTNAMYTDLKVRLIKNLARLENESRSNALLSVSTNLILQPTLSTNPPTVLNRSPALP
jgi:tetratricopeptide (TPR) repeat protein